MKVKTQKGIALGSSVFVIASVVTLALLSSQTLGANTLVEVKVPAGTFYPGNYINITVYCTPTRPVKAFEFKVNFNKNVLQAISVTEGNFFSPYTTFYNPGIINNATGQIKNIYDLVVGVGNKTTANTFVIIKFKAINYGFSYINLTDVGLTNETIYIPRNVTSRSILISSPYDMNSDRNVGLADLLDVSNHYGETGAIGWIKEDVSKDGKISVIDMSLISSHWGTY